MAAKKPALLRLRKEIMAICKDPPPLVRASVDEGNILHWHYLLQGPPDTPYSGGWCVRATQRQWAGSRGKWDAVAGLLSWVVDFFSCACSRRYWGHLRFPPEYPLKPPGITMSTPSGRFKTNTKLCALLPPLALVQLQPRHALVFINVLICSTSCLSMSDFHPETWNPVWSVVRGVTFSFLWDFLVFIGLIEKYGTNRESVILQATVLTGLLSFFAEDTSTTGSMQARCYNTLYIRLY
eukprot:SAG31_NODE_1422_length_8420_cov_2.887514_6_plen_238_part_00